MKLLLDQNLSHRLVDSLQTDFKEIEHVRNVQLHQASDSEIWNFVRDNGFSIVSKDSDFWERAVLEGPPPKVIWIRIGNCTTEEIKRVLQSNQQEIQQFVEETDKSLLTVE